WRTTSSASAPARCRALRASVGAGADGRQGAGGSGHVRPVARQVRLDRPVAERVRLPRADDPSRGVQALGCDPGIGPLGEAHLGRDARERAILRLELRHHLDGAGLHADVGDAPAVGGDVPALQEEGLERGRKIVVLEGRQSRGLEAPGERCVFPGSCHVGELGQPREIDRDRQCPRDGHSARGGHGLLVGQSIPEGDQELGQRRLRGDVLDLVDMDQRDDITLGDRMLLTLTSLRDVVKFNGLAVGSHRSAAAPFSDGIRAALGRSANRGLSLRTLVRVTSSPATSLRRRRYALYALFLLPGLSMSPWVTRTPAVRDLLEASTAQMGLVLFGLSIGSMLGILSSGPLVMRLGTRPVVLAGSTLVVVALPTIALGASAGQPLVTAFGLALFGGGMGGG